jgi:hypothetical protein
LQWGRAPTSVPVASRTTPEPRSRPAGGGARHDAAALFELREGVADGEAVGVLAAVHGLEPLELGLGVRLELARETRLDRAERRLRVLGVHGLEQGALRLTTLVEEPAHRRGRVVGVQRAREDGELLVAVLAGGLQVLLELDQEARERPALLRRVQQGRERVPLRLERRAQLLVDLLHDALAIGQAQALHQRAGLAERGGEGLRELAVCRQKPRHRARELAVVAQEGVDAGRHLAPLRVEVLGEGAGHVGLLPLAVRVEALTEGADELAAEIVEPRRVGEAVRVEGCAQPRGPGALDEAAPARGIELGHELGELRASIDDACADLGVLEHDVDLERRGEGEGEDDGTRGGGQSRSVLHVPRTRRGGRF